MDCSVCGTDFEPVRSWQVNCSKQCKMKKANANRAEYVREYNSAYKETPMARYHAQKNRAKVRGVEFLLSFDEWWSIWEDSFDQRGRLPDQLAMCRYGDTGPYEVGNVYLDTNSNNASMAATLQHQDRNQSDGRFV